MFVKVLFSLFFLSIAFAAKIKDSNEDETTELVFSQLIFRHGARNIDKPYKNDPWGDESNWPGGYGALTNLGKRQHYALGTFLRKRYLGNILENGEYSPDKAYVVSSDLPRTMMSAAVNLAGLFPPDCNQRWSEKLLWQPIPINIPISWKNDYYLSMINAPCERFDYLIKPFQDQDAEDNKELLKHLGTILNESVSLYDAHNVYDVLSIESNNNMTLPEWTKEVFYPGCDLEKLAYNNIKRLTQTKELIQLKSGFLLREIMDRFLAKANSTLEPDYKLFMYSAHDITIANVLNIFGHYEAIPPFASALMFELHRSNEGYYVQMVYKNTTADIYSLNIPGCGFNCRLDDLYELSQPIFPLTDFETGCKLRDDEKDNASN